MKKVAIVTPAYNEEKRIGETLEDYFSYFKKLKKEKKIDFEIIVVLNACKDNTLGEVMKFKCRELKVLNFETKGKCFAIVEGFKEALKGQNNLIGFTDADGATPASAFYDLIKNINKYDGVIPNRWHKKSKISAQQTLLRRITSRGFNFIVRILFLLPYQDTQCGAKVFRRELIEKVYKKLGASNWSFDVDLLFYARRENAKIKSIPTIWEDKKGSKINLKKTPLKMFFSVLRLRLIHSPFKFIVDFYSRVFPERWRIYYWLS